MSQPSYSSHLKKQDFFKREGIPSEKETIAYLNQTLSSSRPRFTETLKTIIARTVLRADNNITSGRMAELITEIYPAAGITSREEVDGWVHALTLDSLRPDQEKRGLKVGQVREVELPPETIVPENNT